MWLELKNFNSSNINHLWYNSINLLLRVLYSSGQQYTYGSVSPILWESLKRSLSKGKYISLNIKSKPYQKRILNG